MRGPRRETEETRNSKNRLLKGVVESPPLEVFQSCVDVALRDVGSGHGGDGLMVGLVDRRGLFQP